MVVDMLLRARVGRGDALLVGPAFRNQALLGTTFFVLAIVIAGVPPLSGFVAKLLMLRSLVSSPIYPLLWASILLSSLLAILGFSRSGSLLFWKCGSASENAKDTQSTYLSNEGVMSRSPTLVLQ